MSRKIMPQLKSVSRLLSKATFTNIAGFAGRMLASACPKEDLSVASQIRSSRSHLTARSAYSLCLPQTHSLEQKEHQLPQHEPNPFALMVPLSTGNPATWLAQQAMLNGWRRRRPPNLTKDSEEKRIITQRLSQLLGLDSLNSVVDCEDQRVCSSSSSSMNMQQSQQMRNLRLEEDRQKAEKRLSPPKTLKTKGKATPFRPYPADSATVLVASWCHHKSASFPRLQEDPRFTTCGNFKLKGELRCQQAYQSRYRPFKTWQRLDDQVTPQPKNLHPINVVRPGIPPLYTINRVSEKVLRMAKTRNYQVELSEKEHESRLTDLVAWIKRRIFF